MDHLVGREDELALVDRFVVAPGPGALLLEGPAGIGKTSIWSAGVGAARLKDRLVLAARPAEPEAHFAYAALGDLLLDLVAGGISSLPAPQRRALEAALRLTTDPGRAEPHAVALAVLTLLRASSEDQGVLVAIDDLHWLDEPTAAALAYAARRLDNVRFLLATRPAQPSPLRHAHERSVLERLEVQPLDLASTRHLLHGGLGLALSRRVVQRVYEASQGNPLFALELGRSLRAAAAAEGATRLPLPATVEELLAERVRSLGEPVRRLLLAATLAPATPASRLSGIDALAAALEAAVVTLDGDRLRPSHPLLGATAVAQARPSERQALHLALASASDDEEQRCRHVALASPLPDEATAARVAAASGQAARRGAAATAAELGEHALRLTPGGSPRHVERCLDAAERLCSAGELARGRAVLAPALGRLPAGAPAVRGYLLACGLDVPPPAGSDLPPWRYWLERALDASAGDPELHTSVVAQRATGLLFTAVSGIAQVEHDLRTAERDAPSNDPAIERRLLFGLSFAVAMQGRPVDEIAARAGALGEAAVPLHLAIERAAAMRLVWRGCADDARALLARLLALADEREEAESYFVLRLNLCELELRAGRLDTAASLLEEWSEEADGPVASAAALARCQALLSATRGERAAAALASEAIELSERTGDRWQWLEAHRAAGLARLAAGEHAHAAAELRLVFEHTTREGLDPGVFPVAADLVEALVACRALDEARAVVVGISRAAAVHEHPWARLAETRCRALLRPLDPASIAALEAAAEDYRRLGLLADRARTLLVLANGFRAGRLEDESRRVLAVAAGAFEELGAVGWAERARAEPVVRSRGRSPSPPSGSDLSELTPAEQRVARLVASGLRNREVAAELFVNEKTVEAHLSRIYAKLGVRSRTELVLRLRTTAREG